MFNKNTDLTNYKALYEFKFDLYILILIEKHKTIREISKNSSLCLSSIFNKCKKLESIGLLHSSTRGRKVFYELTDDALKITEHLNNINTILDKYNI